MKITKIEAVYPTYQETLRAWRPNLWQIILKIHTDKKDIFGYGTGGGGQASIEIINGHFRDFILNKEINNISDIGLLFDKLFFESIPYGRGGIALMALSAIDLAIWDAFSKYNNVTIKNLLSESNFHNKNINTYATGNNVKQYYSLGLKNFKLSVRSEGNFEKESKEIINLIGSIKKNYNVEKIMLDCYMSWSREYTKFMSKNLSDLEIEWIEDISTPDEMLVNESLLSELGEIKLAGGEHDFNFNNFKIMHQKNIYDIWQPDITWCGGISSILKIIEINSNKFKIILHRGGEPWGLPIIEAGIVNNMAELHDPKSIHLDFEQWHNETIETIENGILKTKEYLGFGVNPKKGLFNE